MTQTQVLSGELVIRQEGDIVTARRVVRETAMQMSFPPSDVTRMVTAASELARNIYRYAGDGYMRWNSVERAGSMGLELHFVDQGPGIKDVRLALTEGYSSGGGLGMGLPGAKRLVDEFALNSTPGRGTTVTLRKWRRN